MLIAEQQYEYKTTYNLITLMVCAMFLMGIFRRLPQTVINDHVAIRAGRGATLPIKIDCFYFALNGFQEQALGFI